MYFPIAVAATDGGSVLLRLRVFCRESGAGALPAAIRVAAAGAGAY